MVAVYGGGCLLACAIIAISGVVAAWLTTLIVGVRPYREIEEGRTDDRTGNSAGDRRTRERLGGRGRLAAKADVKARARAKAAEVTARAHERATKVSGRVKDRTADVSGRVKRSQAVQRRWPFAVAAGVLVVGSAVIWRRRRK